ncbi:MAG: LacI family DNA-binding transcriptional regulator [Clostridia bacterium]|nr:LacI family DNA-binding transcriptional regulator [Clostridia bacterium]
MKVTMKQIADKVGVSTVAVHRAITGKPGLSDSMNKKILSAAEELGYVYNTKRLIKSREFLFLTKRIYFLRENEEFYSSIYYNLKNLCDNSGAKLTLHFFESEEEKSLLENLILSKNKISGVFVAGQFTIKDLIKLSKLPLPIVIIDFYSPIVPLNYIYLSSYEDAYRLTYYAISHGHKRIGYISAAKTDLSLTDRFYGIRKALADFQLPYKKEWFLKEKDEASNILSTPLPAELPSVFICHCDLTAKNLITTLQWQKIRVPQDISVLSFDNNKVALECTPQITSLGVNKSDFANSAISLMQEKLKTPGEPKKILLQARLFERESFMPFKK